MPSSLPPPGHSACANEVALRLLECTRLPLDAPLLDLGAGASSFVDVLLNQGYTNLIGVDVSAGAVAAHARQFTPPQNDHVLWLVDDVTCARQLPALETVQLWHDRAMLRVLTLPTQQLAYRNTLNQMTQRGQSWVLLSVCKPGGATHLGDMSVQPYELEQLVAFMGEDYSLQQECEYTELFPDGTAQPCLYALFRRQNQARPAVR
ncbi:class I SAM-dependent methyltransferase [uncultured Hymenobacter sp.]|uniref:class I SAM-dependent methyltransferase n=1 Tax=uncultured Hymenobacter sp. TaxID=170016 RepID=UPI0035C9455E